MSAPTVEGMQNLDGRRPVLVAGAETPTGLGVARALAGERVPVVGLTTDPAAPTCHSRHWHAVAPVLGNTTDAWLTALRSAGARYGRMVLMPADDLVVRTVAHHRAELDGLFDIVAPPLDVVETLLDKTRFHVWAVEHGLPVPVTEVVTDQAELRAALAEMPFPVVLKPFERTAAWQAVSMRDKVHRLASPADLDRLPFRPFDVADRFVVQEWIPGRDSDVWFCLTYRDRDGHEMASQVGRKLAQWPVDTGSTAVAVTAENEEMAALARKVFDASGMVGTGSLEARRSSRDGRLLITEPTVGRPNLQSGLATAAGRNLTAIAYRDALQLPQRPAQRPREAVWVHETALPRSVVVAGRQGTLDTAALRGAFRDVLRGRARAGAFGAPGDREPARREVARLAKKAGNALLRR
jgi:D-aspartate ligase